MWAHTDQRLLEAGRGSRFGCDWRRGPLRLGVGWGDVGGVEGHCGCAERGLREAGHTRSSQWQLETRGRPGSTQLAHHSKQPTNELLQRSIQLVTDDREFYHDKVHADRARGENRNQPIHL